MSCKSYTETFEGYILVFLPVFGVNWHILGKHPCDGWWTLRSSGFWNKLCHGIAHPTKSRWCRKRLWHIALDVAKAAHVDAAGLVSSRFLLSGGCLCLGLYDAWSVWNLRPSMCNLTDRLLQIYTQKCPYADLPKGYKVITKVVVHKRAPLRPSLDEMPEDLRTLILDCTIGLRMSIVYISVFHNALWPWNRKLAKVIDHFWWPGVYISRFLLIPLTSNA